MADKVSVESRKPYCFGCDLGFPLSYAHTCGDIKGKKETDVIWDDSTYQKARHDKLSKIRRGHFEENLHRGRLPSDKDYSHQDLLRNAQDGH